MIKYIAIILTVFFYQKIYAIELTGIPKIVDGDTIHIDSHKIRLEGIDAPEMKQKCKKDYLKISSLIGFNFQKEYFCGETAKKKLKEKIDKMEVKCISSGKDRYQRYLATCFLKKINLNKWMVRNGFAIVYRRYSKDYIEDEDYAKENKLGLWSGTFLEPEKWRKAN